MNGLPSSFSGSVCLTVGLGRSNRALLKLLSKEGSKIYVSDKRKSKKEISEILKDDNIKNAEIISYGENVKADFVFRTPGISPNEREIRDVVARGATLTSDTELFFSRAKGKIYGITGSDGKTTTTSITGEMLKNAYSGSLSKVYVGGNIGTPLISFLDTLTEKDITVAELSSFQLMTLSTSPEISAITNITENHLDYHRDMREYIDAKCNIFKYPECRSLVANKKTKDILLSGAYSLPESSVEVSLNGECDGVYLKDNGIFLYGKRVMDKDEIKIPGMHNVENYMTAIGITKDDCDADSVIKTAREFCGAQHRMQFVREVKGVKFYNSSIDSTPSRSAVTLKCFEKPLTVIAGGYDKNLNYGIFAEEAVRRADFLVLTGDTAETIKKVVETHGGGNIKIYCEKGFDEAFYRAASITKPGGKVLLSPASASFDMFENFEQRGKRFCELVREL